MVVCKFFLQGNCRFGANCRYEHPAGQGGSSGGGGAFGNQNRFGALSSNTGTNRIGGATDNSKPYTLNIADVRLDLTRGQGRPQWVLSTYGAGRNTPASLFEGNEYSPEEIRARFYEMASKGQETQADQEAVQLWTKAERDLDDAANHVDDVAKFMDEAEKKHPNRYDFLKADGSQTRDQLAQSAEASSTTASPFGTTSTFGQQANNTTSNPFSKPASATFGQPTGPSAFGASAFGKPAQPSSFGQPAFGQSGFGASTSGFGQSSGAFGQNNSTTTFGQAASAGAFGKPAFGASGFGQSSFGQAAQPAPASASTFGQSPQPSTQSVFGQSSSTPAFGASTFGQPAKPNPFAAPSASAGFGASTSTFGQSAQTAPAFGQQSQPSTSFGQSTQAAPAFGQATQPTSVFGQSSFNQPTQPSTFGQSTFGQPAQPASNSPFTQTTSATSGFGTGNNGISTFSQPIQQNQSPFAAKTTEVSMDAGASGPKSATTSVPSNPFGTPQSITQTQSTMPAPAPAPPQPNNSTSNTPHSLTSKPAMALYYTQTLPLIPPQSDIENKLTSYRGQRVVYVGEKPGIPCYNRPDGQGLEKIWFLDAGATQEVVFLNREDKIADLQEDSDKYTDSVKQDYAYLFETGQFKDGKIPLVAPMRDWCLYDF